MGSLLVRWEPLTSTLSLSLQPSLCLLMYQQLVPCTPSEEVLALITR
ncbi:unnamed protein product [Brassica oleracea var. botrytis]